MKDNTFDKAGHTMIKYLKSAALLVILVILPANAIASKIVKLKGSNRPIMVSDNYKSNLAMNAMVESADVEYIEPNYAIKLDGMPNDPLWYGTNDWRVIDFPTAWSGVQNANAVKIAIIDTGITVDHPDFDSSMMVTHGNSVDEQGHGTYVYGIIAAVGNNNEGVIGLDWNINKSILVYRFIDGNGNGDVWGAINSIYNAVDEGAGVINASWGTSEYSYALRDAIAYAGEHGCLVVCSAGNDSADNEYTAHYPSNYNVELDNVISVAALDQYGLAWYSNYGNTVDVVAPGSDIITTSPDGYIQGSGTSFSAPYVTALVAMLMSQNPNMTSLEIKNRILTTTVAHLDNMVNVCGGVISAKNALANTGVHNIKEVVYTTPAEPTEPDTDNGNSSSGGGGGGGCFISCTI